MRGNQLPALISKSTTGPVRIPYIQRAFRAAHSKTRDGIKYDKHESPYVAAPFALTHKANFPILVSPKSEFLSVSVIGLDSAEIGPSVDTTGRFGLFSIRVRLEALGGHMEVESKPGHGTRVTLVAPLKYNGGNKKDKVS